MKTQEARDIAKSVKEMNKDYAALVDTVNTVANGTDAAKKLWKNGNKNILMKAGIALLVFPEPVVSDMLGSILLAAGAVQEGIRRQSIYLDDLPKALRSTFRDLIAARNLL